MISPAPTAGRIVLLSPLVIDQIAAGEVVERPASVVKELVDNSLDAEATRVDVELEEGGLARISVRDNGRGIHPEDLLLSVTRHATSKLRDASELTDIRTLGFRGEALASIASVARVDIRSRPLGAALGHHLHAIPGEPPVIVPAGMPVGTQIEVHALFANVPARRKFMRAEATEVGQCSETLLRLAIVHPEVHFTLRHGKRELLSLPRATLEGRVAQVLERRVAGPFFVYRGAEEGIEVCAVLPHPQAVARGRGSPYLVVRRRVVRERALGQILAQVYGMSEAPSACLFVEPPVGAVDVNVHPQKAEVRFRDPQQVYAAVRRILADAVAAAPWAGELARAAAAAEEAASQGPAAPPIGFTARAEAAREPRATARAGDGAREAARADGAPAEAAPGPQSSAAARAAVGATAARRAEADAWIARAEAALDASRPIDLSAAPAPEARPPARARPRGEAPAGPAEPEWDLDVGPAEGAQVGPGGGAPGGGAPGPGEKMALGTAGAAGPELPAPAAVADAAWRIRAGEDDPALRATLAAEERARAGAWLERAGAEVDLTGEVPLLRWSERQPDAAEETGPPEPALESRPAQGYRLATRALGGGYAEHKRAVMEAAAALRPGEAPAGAPAPTAEAPALFESAAPGPLDMREASGPNSQPARPDLPALLVCLPGPVAIFAEQGALLAVDLRRIRSHLVYLRLQRDLLGRRVVAVQGLLTPAVVRRPEAEVALLSAARAELLTLGVDLDAFGADAVVVRGVPAHLRHCVDDADAADLVARIVPWLRIRAGDGERAARERGLLDAIATTRGGDPAPRLARRWLAELLEAGATLDAVPGIRRWGASDLLGGA